MKAWASEHGEADTQGLMDDEWEALATAALGLPPKPICECDEGLRSPLNCWACTANDSPFERPALDDRPQG
jgi:hypothetical protein